MGKGVALVGDLGGDLLSRRSVLCIESNISLDGLWWTLFGKATKDGSGGRYSGDLLSIVSPCAQ